MPDLRALDRYPWTGHSALMGRRTRPWQAVADVLGHFGRGQGGRERYRAFMAAGIAQGRRGDLQGGGLRRSLGGWEGVAALRRGREAWTSDERVLGSRAFVQRPLADLPRPLRPRPEKLEALLARIAAAWRLTPAELTGGGRRHPLVAARYAASYLGVRHLGLPAAAMARTLNVSLQAVLRGVDEGSRILADRGLDAAKVVERL